MITLHQLTISNFKALRSIDIVLPQHASVLIEGLNESGKSSLFEAVIFALYGEPLITEETGPRGKGKIESVINHQANEMRVRLAVQVSETRLEIERSLKRGGSTQARLAVITGDRRETVTRQTAVNARILQELGNLTKDALLNSCFVEQKQLGKLEEMGVNERRESLEQLLNLARLQRIQKQQQVTKDEEREVTLARRRWQFAQKQADLRAREAELAQATHHLARLRLVEAFFHIHEAQARTTALQQERAMLAHQREELSATQARLAALTDAAKDLANLNGIAAQLAQHRHEARRVADEMARCDHAEREIAPAMTIRLQALTAISGLFQQQEMLLARQREAEGERAAIQQRIAEVAARRDLLQRDMLSWERRRQDYAQAQSDLAQTQAELAAHQQRMPRLVAARDQARARLLAGIERSALERWLSVADDAGRIAQTQAERLAAEKALAQSETQARWHEQQIQQAWQRVVLSATSAAASAAIAIALIIFGMLWGTVLLLAAAGLGMLAWQSHSARNVLRARYVSLLDEQRAAQSRLMQAQAKEHAWAEFGGGKIQEDAARTLREHGLPVPADVPAARARLAALPKSAANQGEWQAALDEAERALNTAQLQCAADERRIADIQQQVRAMPDPAAEGEALRRHLAELDATDHRASLDESDAALAQIAGELAALAQTISEQCRKLNLAPESAAVLQALGGTRHELELAQATIASRPQWQQRAAAVQHELAALKAEGQALWQRLRRAAPDLMLAETPSFESADLEQIEQRHATLLRHLEADGARSRLEELSRRDGTLEHELAAQADIITQQRAIIEQIASNLNIAGAPEESAIRAALPDLPPVTTPEEIADIAARMQDLDRLCFSLRQDLATLASELGLTVEETLDVAACAADLAAREHEVRVKRVAEQIVESVRDRMIQKVLPKTEENMRLLLPQLTMGRYRDCEITPDYKLQIWDDAAGRPVAKNIFSGGARDQFSLALRLAFALATLPEALGTTPGFIFLDEPLSSFDAPRSEALVDLLTRGQIHDNFSQIFVISHNLLFDRRAFTHHLRLEYGAVVESTLPDH